MPADTSEPTRPPVPAKHRPLELLEDRPALTILAASLAHEINNPLAYLMANLEFALDEVARVRLLLASHLPSAALLPGGQPLLQGGPRLADVEAALGDALDGAERVRKVVKNLRALSREETTRPETIQLKTALDAALEVTAAEVRPQAKLVCDLRETPLVDVNRSQLSQVLANLVTNAAQSVARRAGSDGLIKIACGTDTRGWAYVEVQDSGMGLPPEIAEGPLDLFSNRPLQMKRGLGLSISQALVDGMGGEIRAAQNQPRGAVFRVSLPPSAIRADKAPAAVRRRILIVDDEAAICSSMRRILGPAYAIETTTDPAGALKRFEAGERFDLILCDLMMPQVTGMDLHREL